MTADQLRKINYGAVEAVRDGYKLNRDDDRFLVAYKGEWPDTDEFLFLHYDANEAEASAYLVWQVDCPCGSVITYGEDESSRPEACEDCGAPVVAASG